MTHVEQTRIAPPVLVDYPRYVVAERSDGWCILYRGEIFGPYRSRSEAMLFAVDAAYGIGKRVGRAEVVIEGEKDHFHTEWSFGESPYPPRSA